ncbi:hypothetical protein B0H14DRAFT_2711695 [Mycena olivaceomarginata]|nr:hypothetical protein B0H14DRAFT_2711695 [Mycena olivaceomarginata]
MHRIHRRYESVFSLSSHAFLTLYLLLDYTFTYSLYIYQFPSRGPSLPFFRAISRSRSTFPPLWKGRLDRWSPAFYFAFPYLPYGTPVLGPVLCFVRTHV